MTKKRKPRRIAEIATTTAPHAWHVRRTVAVLIRKMIFYRGPSDILAETIKKSGEELFFVNVLTPLRGDPEKLACWSL